MNEEKIKDQDKCDVCGGVMLISENEIYQVRVVDGKIRLVESYGCEFSKVWCRDCGSDILTENDANEVEIEYNF